MATDTTVASRFQSRRLADILCCALLIAFYSAWYWPGVFGGQVFYDEDVAASFFTWRASLYGLAHGAAWSWWDPFTGLGIPRFGTILVGYFSPVSLLFYLVPTTTAYGIYPALVMSLLACFTYGLFRTRGPGPLPALFGALSWSTISAITTHIQHPSYIETILWLPATLLAWQLYCRSRSGVWAAAAGLGLAFQCFGASPQYLLYNLLVMAAWIASTLWEQRTDPRELRRSALAACGVAVAGLGIASWQLLPAMEYSELSHRSLLHATAAFADHYRAAPHEVGLALSAEAFTVIEPPPLAYGGGLYPNVPNVSLLTLVFALAALYYRPRRIYAWCVAVFFLLGMLGSAGGVNPLIQTFFPFAERMRAPIRMLIPAAFWLAWLAACGMDGWLRRPDAIRKGLTIAAILWLVLLGWFLRRPTDLYVEPEFFDVPAAIRTADDRVAVDILGSRRPVLFALNSGVAAGTRTLMTRDALWPANFWAALYASQFGSLANRDALDQRLTAAAMPLRKPALPLLRSFGLRSLIRRTASGEYQVLPIPNPVPDVFLATETHVMDGPEQSWAFAASDAWDPTREIFLDRESPGPVPSPEGDAPAGAKAVSVLVDEPDRQVIEVTSDGGVLVSSSLFYPGWTVTVDGVPAEALEVNLALRGVAIARGTHRVEWRYWPTWFGLALLASSVGVLALLSLAIGLRPRATANL